jgi:hypothetical protein
MTNCKVNFWQPKNEQFILKNKVKSFYDTIFDRFIYCDASKVFYTAYLADKQKAFKIINIARSAFNQISEMIATKIVL